MYILKLYLTLVNGFRKHSSLLCNRVTQPKPKLSDSWGGQPCWDNTWGRINHHYPPQPFPNLNKNMKCNKCTTNESYDITYNVYIHKCICTYIHIYTNVCYLLSWSFFSRWLKFSFLPEFSQKTKVRMVEIAILTMGPFKDVLPWRLPWRTSTGLRCLRS